MKGKKKVEEGKAEVKEEQAEGKVEVEAKIDV